MLRNEGVYLAIKLTNNQTSAHFVEQPAYLGTAIKVRMQSLGRLIPVFNRVVRSISHLPFAVTLAAQKAAHCAAPTANCQGWATSPRAPLRAYRLPITVHNSIGRQKRSVTEIACQVLVRTDFCFDRTIFTWVEYLLLN